MRNSLFVFLIFTLLSASFHAQNTEDIKYKFGGQTILGITTLNGDYAKQFQRYKRPSLGFGLIGERHISDRQFFNVELNLCAQQDSTFQTWKITQDTVLVTDSLRLGTRLVYFQVPFMFGYKFPMKKEERAFYIKGGPYFGILWSAIENRRESLTSPSTHTSTFYHGNQTQHYEKVDFGFQMAVGLYTGDDGVLEFRFSEGITNLLIASPTKSVYNRMISFNFRYYLYQD